MTLNETHDPRHRSWVESANEPRCDFPIQNLPYGVFSVGNAAPRVGVAIGNKVLDFAILEIAGLVVPLPGRKVFNGSALNDFMALGPTQWSSTRRAIGDLLETGQAHIRDDTALRERALVPVQAARLHLPMRVQVYTDVCASKEHATNVGVMLRDPDNALLPNWLHIPIGYNCRASTVVASGTPVRRSLGQLTANRRAARHPSSVPADAWTSSLSSASWSAPAMRWACP